jgi:hypothetical protein
MCWTISVNKIIVIFLKFAKVFDKVPHVRLLGKVKSMGTDGKLLKRIEA